MAKTPQQVAAKWAANLQNNIQSVTDGVNAVTQSPTAKAAENLDAYVRNTMAAVQSGRMAASLNAVSLDQWKTAFLQKGIPRIQGGAQQAIPKVQKFMSSWLPVMQAASAQVAGMPKGTTQAALDRVRVIIEAGKNYAGKTS